MFMWLPFYVIKEFKFCLPTVLKYISENVFFLNLKVTFISKSCNMFI